MSGNISPVHAETAKGKPYYRLELPRANISANDFKLHEAHVSIYKNLVPDNDSMGPSHFTAVFHNANGQAFRMHLYLNNSDQLACPPTWEKWEHGERAYNKVEPPKNIECLVHSIWQHGSSCLQALRQQQAKLEDGLIKKYKKHNTEMTALSEDLSKNGLTYLENLDVSLQLAKCLAEVSENPSWGKLFSFLGQMKKNILRMPESKAEVKNSQQLLMKGKDKKRQSQTPISSAPQTLFSRTKGISELQKQINAVKTTFKQMKESSNEHIKGVLLIDLNEQLLKIDLGGEESLAVEQLNELRKIEEALSGLAKILLQTALLKKNYDFARILSPFYDQVRNSQNLTRALMQKDSGFLAFLVQDVGLAINNCPVTINEKEYTNVAHYLYDCGSSNLQDCFAVLIQHGLNLMQPVGPDQLPLAHLIISENHCLHTAFEQNKSLTLNNKHFYGQLVYELKRCSDSASLDESKKAELKTWVTLYEQKKTSVENQQVLLNHGNQLRAEELADIAKTLLSKAVLDALEKDLDFIREKASMDKILTEMVKKDSVFRRSIGQQYPLQSLIRELNKGMKEELLKAESDIKASFSLLKEMALQCITNAKKLAETQMALIDVQNDIRTILKPKHRKLSRTDMQELSRLNQESKKLLAVIENLKQFLPYPLLKMHNESETGELVEILEQFERQGHHLLPPELMTMLNELDEQEETLFALYRQAGASTDPVRMLEKKRKQLLENLDGAFLSKE